ncbi:hypothetical protein [Dyella telluris]|uniref:Secreted protein n=1 Tax=Dyella telluris TaxID=2763498 RepID=A0A7G8Q8K7_9GAMM|nr:hypothetical protein [Dyella telluris]QNK03115.1 hypothetical protein H8F01_08395 [Dyella telluris]
MNIQARKTALYCATLAGLLVLSACGKNQESPGTPSAAPGSSAPAPAAPAPTTTAPPTPAPTSTAPAPEQTTGKAASVKSGGEIKVAAVTIGSQVDAGHAISREQRQFAPEDKSIYASVATTGTSDNATLNAKWSYIEGQDETFSSTTESIATDGPAVTTFKVQNPNAWPKGKYKVIISLNGKQVASEGFEVRG